MTANIYLLPRTKQGKWSIGLIMCMVLSYGLLRALLASGLQGGATFFANMPLAIVMIVMLGAGILSFFTGAFSFFKKERSVVVLLSALIGLFTLYFTLSQIINPQ
jgi:hypothetical protein